MRTIFTVLIVMTFCTTSQAAERWEGIWAQTRHECAAKEGPSSRTLIDLSNKEKGQLAPSYRRILVTEASGGGDLSLRSDNLDSVGELYTEDNFRQLVVAIEATPTFFGSLGELEDHGERSLA